MGTRHPLIALRQCRAILAIQLRVALSFRTDLVLQLIRSLLSIVVYYCLWRAVFAAHPRAGGLDFTFMVAYIVLVQVVHNLTRPPDVARELAQGIQEGGIVVHFVRPYALHLYFLAETLGAVAWRVVWVVLPLFLVALALGFPLASAAQVGLFLASLPFALVTNLSIEMTLGLAAAWLRQNEGLIQFRNFLQSFFSGALVPLALFPPPLSTLARWLPFRSTVDVPLGLYLGYLGPESLMIQASWALGLWLFSLYLLVRARKQLTIFGG